MDADGNAYVAGQTQSSNFPVTPGAYSNSAGSVDAFVTKFAPDGTGLIYSTFLGGSGSDIIRGIAINEEIVNAEEPEILAYFAYVTGQTSSSNFSIAPDPFDPVLGGSLDAFVTKLNSDASDLVYSTYLGGSGEDIGNAIAVDVSGNAYVAGQTLSSDFPISNEYQNVIKGGWDAFVTKIVTVRTVLYFNTRHIWAVY